MSKPGWIVIGVAVLAVMASFSNDSDNQGASQNTSEESPKNDPVLAGSAMCNVFDSTGVVTECDVSGWNASVDVTIDISSSGAREVCRKYASRVSEETTAFSDSDRNWELKIYSPYSGDNAIAKCDLY